MIYRACFRCGDGVFQFCFDGAAEFDTVSITFTPRAFKDHFKTCIAKRCAVRAKYFGFLCISSIDRDEGFRFQVVNDEIVYIPLIISRISDEEGAPLEFIETFELFDKRFGDFGIGSVIGKSGLNERDALDGSDNMSSIAPEEFKCFRSVCLFLIAVIMQGSLWVTAWFFVLVPGVTIRVFRIILTGGGFNGLGIHDESVKIHHILVDKDFIDFDVNLLHMSVGYFFQEAVEL